MLAYEEKNRGNFSRSVGFVNTLETQAVSRDQCAKVLDRNTAGTCSCKSSGE